MPHLTGKLVHGLDVRGERRVRPGAWGPEEAECKLLKYAGPSVDSRPAPPPPGLRNPAPLRPALSPGPWPLPGRGCSRSAAAPPGRRHRPARSRWTGRPPPRGTAREACPPPGLRAGSRSPPGIRPAARGRPSWGRQEARPPEGSRARSAGARGGTGRGALRPPRSQRGLRRTAAWRGRGRIRGRGGCASGVGVPAGTQAPGSKATPLR